MVRLAQPSPCPYRAAAGGAWGLGSPSEGGLRAEAVACWSGTAGSGVRAEPHSLLQQGP